MKCGLHIFHHTDLDGMGVKILSILYAKIHHIPYETHCCGYSRIDKEVRKCLMEDAPDGIIIGDISVDSDTAKMLNNAHKRGMKLHLYDHHEPAMFLNEYSWAEVATSINGSACCGTKLLSEASFMKAISSHMRYFINLVNDWDTWEWKENNNQVARQLNSLFSILGEDEFTNYIVDKIYVPSIVEPSGYHLGYISKETDLFTLKSKIMMETHQKLIDQQVLSCEKYMYTMNLWVQIPNKGESSRKIPHKTVSFKTGIIFLNDNLSEVGDKILDRNPELDILMIMVFPGNISWRTHKDLPISLSKIAKMATGSGGGHSQASGSNIPFAKFQDSLCRFMDDNFSSHLEYSNLVSAYVRRKREEEKQLKQAEQDLFSLFKAKTGV